MILEIGWSISIAHNEKVFGMAGYSVFRHTCTDAIFVLLLKIHFIVNRIFVALITVAE